MVGGSRGVWSVTVNGRPVVSVVIPASCQPPMTACIAPPLSLIHFRPVEYPVLLVIGLVLGFCAWRTQRLGMGIFVHMGFNAAGLAWVATR